MDTKNETAENAANPTPAVKPTLVVAVSENISKMEFNGKEATEKADMLHFIKIYIRARVLRQFGVSEVAKVPVGSGALYFNDGVKTSLKLPKVKETKNGAFAESLETYYNRCIPDISKWLLKAYQNSSITVAQVDAMGN